MPALRAQPLDLLEDPRLRDDVEAGRRLVHHDGRRLADERRRDRHALLLAARELVRIAARERRSAGKMRRARAPQHRGRVPSRRRAPRACPRTASPTRSDGFSAAAGSCGTYETTRPAKTPCLGLARPGETRARRPRPCRRRCDTPAARTRAAPARSSSSRSPTRRRARGSRRRRPRARRPRRRGASAWRARRGGPRRRRTALTSGHPPRPPRRPACARPRRRPGSPRS